MDSPSEDDGDIEENDFEENASNMMSALLRSTRSAFGADSSYQSERSALVRSRRVNNDDDDDDDSVSPA